MMLEEVKKLPIEFIGKGEVKGFYFRQIKRGQKACLYEVTTQWNTVHYEIFEIRVFLTPKTKQKYEAYPKANAFGVWAWTTSIYEKAVKKFETINQ